ncbi:hypothetical protein DZA50_01430 [Kangiella sp. HD9-110m-PIT-SAG07]|nr:hypothetical protein DZA50_01430 [Kangiella sp. HD9-110m-PIT-SAG07]
MVSLPERSISEWQYRLMSPMGVYPSSDIHIDGAGLVVTESLVAVACPNAELGNENILRAAILCSSVAASDSLRFYSFPNRHQLLDPCVQSQLGEQLSFDVRQKQAAEYVEQGETVPEFDWYENAKGASLPPILDGTDYHLVDIELDVKCIQALYKALKTSNCPKLIGASKALIASNALSCHYQFRQEACGLLLDGLRLMQEVELFHSESAQLSTILAQLGDSAEDYLISRQQMSEEVGPIDFHRLFVQTCTQLRKFLSSH